MQRRACVSVVAICAITALASADREREAAELPNPLVVIYFATSSAIVRDPDLAPAAAWLAAHPNRLLLVEGYADRRGSWHANLRLSHRRADAVRDALVRIGADPLRIVTAAHSENEPAGTAAKSRRVEVSGTVQPMPELVREQQSGGLDPRSPQTEPRNEQ